MGCKTFSSLCGYPSSRGTTKQAYGWCLISFFFNLEAPPPFFQSLLKKSEITKQLTWRVANAHIPLFPCSRKTNDLHLTQLTVFVIFCFPEEGHKSNLNPVYSSNTPASPKVCPVLLPPRAKREERKRVSAEVGHPSGLISGWALGAKSFKCHILMSTSKGKRNITQFLIEANVFHVLKRVMEMPCKPTLGLCISAGKRFILDRN